MAGWTQAELDDNREWRRTHAQTAFEAAAIAAIVKSGVWRPEDQTPPHAIVRVILQLLLDTEDADWWEADWGTDHDALVAEEGFRTRILAVMGRIERGAYGEHLTWPAKLGRPLPIAPKVT